MFGFSKSAALLLSLLLISSSDLQAQNKPDSVSNLERRAVSTASDAALDGYLTTAAALGFSGAVLVAKDGEVVLSKGYGETDRARRVPVTHETVFDIGSITKQFTAAAILKLEMHGKLDTSDLLSKHLPKVLGDKSGVTLHHLLTHTSGLPVDSGGDYDTALRDETIKRTLSMPLASEPGKKYSYSNTGYSLLAVVVERVSGEAYESYLKRNLFDSAGMRSTGYRLVTWDKNRLARGYNGERDHGTPLDHNWSESGPYWNLMGNGGILSTVTDLYKWRNALQGERVLSAAAKRKLFSPFLDDYAYGWVVSDTSHGKLINHNGGSSYGFAADFHIYPEKGVTIIILTNGTAYENLPFVNLLMSRITPTAFGEALPDYPKLTPVGVAPARVKRYTGAYQLPTGERIVIARALPSPRRASARVHAAACRKCDPSLPTTRSPRACLSGALEKGAARRVAIL